MRLCPWHLVLFALCGTAAADHTCIEELPSGTKVERSTRFPDQWFLVGNQSILDPKFHAALKRQYSGMYVSGKEEGPYGVLCLKAAEQYVSVATNDFGVNVAYSRKPPKCQSCKAAANPESTWMSGTDVALGMTRAQVSAALGLPLPDGSTITVQFEETESDASGKVIHEQSLRLSFSGDVLVRFILDDNREGA
jgi:hypothetical protein